MIVLSKEQIEKMVDPDQMMDQIEEAYRIYGSGEFYMPPRPTVEHENKQLMYMPCYTKDIIGTKILSIFPENSKLGLPSIDGIVFLNDYTTGAPLAVMDGQTVTAWRTGAVGGVGIRHLSRKDCRTVGIIGAGMQGFHQAVYACAARDIHTVYVFNHSDRDLTDYLERLKKAIDKEDVKVVQCKAVEELVRNSDIICTTTPSTTPVLPDDKELLRGKCIIAIGSYMHNGRGNNVFAGNQFNVCLLAAQLTLHGRTQLRVIPRNKTNGVHHVLVHNTYSFQCYPYILKTGPRPGKTKLS